MTSNDKPDPICEPCLAGKMHANPFPSSKNRSTRLLELVHTDVHKVGTPTHSGYQYWVTFIDDFSRFRVVIPIKTKDMTFDAFKQFKAYAENQTGHKIKALRDDKHRFFASYSHHPLFSLCVLSLPLTSSRDLPLSYTQPYLPVPVEPQLRAWPLFRGLHLASQGQKVPRMLLSPPLLFPPFLPPFSLLQLLPHGVLRVRHGRLLSLPVSSRPLLNSPPSPKYLKASSL